MTLPTEVYGSYRKSCADSVVFCCYKSLLNAYECLLWESSITFYSEIVIIGGAKVAVALVPEEPQYFKWHIKDGGGGAVKKFSLSQ